MNRVLSYHERTKHHPERYAPGPGGLDWDNQPNPFRRYEGSPLLKLPLIGAHESGVASGVLFGVGRVDPQPMGVESVGRFFELALGLSARKETGLSSWYLRMNPSSGNLHPTEAYVFLPALEGGSDEPGIYHYAPREHGLELRAHWSSDNMQSAQVCWIALTSVVWREAWKYGERAFRYCQHDVGHALAALRFSAAVLGWHLSLEPAWTEAQLGHALGLDRDGDFAAAEREIPEVLVRVDAGPIPERVRTFQPLNPSDWLGTANRLSPWQAPWPAIDEAIRATARTKPGTWVTDQAPLESGSLPNPPCSPCTAPRLIRQRRSAVRFDGVTSVSLGAFVSILDVTLPGRSTPPLDLWPWLPELHLILFVHRVEGLDPGVYCLLRRGDHEELLRGACRSEFEWTPLMTSSAQPPLYRLMTGNVQDFAEAVSCGQSIASESAFSLGMLARFEPVLRERGAAAYRELFWETGMIGQALYLAAEAAGLRGTGIGCYFDDVMHRALGLSGHHWQSLYHFTIGGPVDDPRLRTTPPYEHLRA